MDELALTLHAAALPVAFLALYRFAERSKESMSLNETAREASKELQTRISTSLRDYLKPVFDSTPAINMASIVNELGDPFFPNHNPPQASRAFSDALSEFVRERQSSLTDLCSLQRHQRRWTFWGSCRGWITLAATFWEAIAASYFGLCTKVWPGSVNECLIVPSFALTGALVLGFLTTSAATLYSHDRITRLASNDG